MSANEYESLRRECGRLIRRLHDGLDVVVDLHDGDPDRDHTEELKKIRVALLRLACDHMGDPDAEETLAREGHSV